MPSARHSSASFRPISGGNTVTVAIQLYRAHFRQYLQISGIATLWAMCPFLAAGIFALVGYLLSKSATDSKLGLILAVIILLPIWFFLLFWCMAKSLRNLGLLSRLAYQELVGQPETPAQARRQLRSAWWFLLMQFLLSLLFQIASFVIQIFFLLLGGLLGFVGGLIPSVGLGSEWIGLIGSLLTVLGFCSLYFWFCAKLFLPEVALGVEPKTDGVSALGRSWALSHGAAMRILIALTSASFVTAPLYTLSLTPIWVGIGVGVSLFPNVDKNSPEVVAVLIGIFVVLLVISFLIISFLIVPFWQALKAVLYFDLRIRREGLGLQLPDRTA